MIFYLWIMTQALCENLPISSSGHVALLLKFLGGFDGAMIASDVQAFDYLLQGMSVLVFFIYFFSSWWQLIVQRPIAWKFLCNGQVWKKNILPVVFFGLVADGATALVWCLDIAKKIQFPLFAGFMITLGFLWSMRDAQDEHDVDLWSLKNGLIVGVMQGFALLPGVSRFATTMATLQWLGYARQVAFPISFLLQWPLIVAGSIKGFLFLRNSMFAQSLLTQSFLWTILCAMLISYAMISWIGRIVEKNLLWKFAYYMIIPITIALII